MRQSPGEAAFTEQHRIEENKFDSFEAAEHFFKERGFPDDQRGAGGLHQT